MGSVSLLALMHTHTHNTHTHTHTRTHTHTFANNIIRTVVVNTDRLSEKRP